MSLQRIIAFVIAAALLAWPASAGAQTGPASIAGALRADPVYVDPGAKPTLSPADAGRIRLRILERNLGRIKVAVVPGRLAERAGGIAPLANSIDHELATPGTLIVAAGRGLYAVTSYPQVDQVVAALRQAVTANAEAGLAEQILSAVNRIARLDPGPGGDLVAPTPPTSPIDPSAGEDFLDGVLGLFRLVGFAVAALVALPLVVLGARGLWRWNARRQQADDELEMGRRRGRDSLIKLGDDIRALDIDVSMPNADRAAVADYEHALARYEEASRALDAADTPRRVELATAALDEGRRRMEAAKARLATPSPAAEPSSGTGHQGGPT